MSISRPAGVLSLAALFLTGAAGSASSAELSREDHDCRKAVEMKVYAQVNRAALFAGSGNADETFFVDNDNSSTRFGFKGTGHVNCDVAVGANIEIETESNASDNISFDQSGTAGFNLKERLFDTWISHSSVGKISLGQGKTASDGTMEVDFSKTTVISGSDMKDFMGGLEHAFAGGAISMVEIKDVMQSYDGNARQDRARYDTPKFFDGSLYASTSSDDDNTWDVAVRFARKFGGTKFAAAAHFVDGNTSSYDSQHGGSASILFPVGLNLTVAYSGRNFSGRKSSHYHYVKAGFVTHPFEDIGLGHTAFAVDYGRNANHAMPGDRATGYGAYVVQQLISGVEAYVGARNHSLKRSGVKFKDVFGVMTGLRIKM